MVIAKEVMGNIVSHVCRGCNSPFTQWNFRHASFCSKKCFLGFARINKEEKSWAWKGDAVGYHGLHKWIQSRLGKPKTCWACGTTKAKRYEWANKSKKYKRSVSDWVRLCKSCHLYFDGISYTKPKNYSL